MVADGRTLMHAGGVPLFYVAGAASFMDLDKVSSMFLVGEGPSKILIASFRCQGVVILIEGN